MPEQIRGLAVQDEFTDRASSRGLSVEQVRKRFIHNEYFIYDWYIAPVTPAATGPVLDHILVALQGVNRGAVI